MAEFVGQDRFHFLGCERLEQGVEEHDALVGAEAGEVGVAVAGAAGAVHHEHAAAAKATALQQVDDALAQGLVVQRLELVEQRRDEGRPGPEHEQAETHPYAPHVQPPVGAGGLHQPQHQPDQRRADEQGEQELLDQIRDEGGRGGAVETEAFLEPEGAVDGKGQVEQAADYQHAEDHADAGGHRRPAQAAPGLIQPFQAAAQGPAEQQQGAIDQFRHAQPGPRHGVIGGLAVGFERDVIAEGLGHRIAVGEDVTDLAPVQPQLQQQREGQGDEENLGNQVHVISFDCLPEEGFRRLAPGFRQGKNPRVTLPAARNCRTWRKIPTTSSGSIWK